MYSAEREFSALLNRGKSLGDRGCKVLLTGYVIYFDDSSLWSVDFTLASNGLASIQRPLIGTVSVSWYEKQAVVTERRLIEI